MPSIRHEIVMHLHAGRSKRLPSLPEVPVRDEDPSEIAPPGRKCKQTTQEKAMMNLEKAQEDYRKRQQELLTIRRRHEQQAKEYSEFMRTLRQRNGRESGRG